MTTRQWGPLSRIARQTVAEIEALGCKAVAIEADITRKPDALRMVDDTVRHLGRLDILAYNAGVVSISTVEKMPEDTWDVTMAVNAKGVFLSCQAAIPHLKRNGGGCIINIASVAGKNGAPGMAHYCASKFAVVGFTNALAKEVARFNIRVNAICPGILRTQMWEYLADTLKQPGESKEESWQRFVQTLIPQRRPQPPADIGALAVYLGHRRKRHRPGNERRWRHGAPLRAAPGVSPAGPPPLRRGSGQALVASPLPS